MKTFIAFIALLSVAATNETYTAKIPGWQFTNVVAVVRNHEPNCHLIRYVQNGATNEFHAWAVPVVVITNRTDKVK